MYCKICGIENPDEALYCKNCGNPMVEKKEVISCPHCEQENDKESVFCKKCGKELVCNEDDIAEKTKEVNINEAKNELRLMGLLGLFIGAPFFGGVFGLIIAFIDNNEEIGINAGLFVACGVALISLCIVVISFLTKQIDLRSGEYLLMQELTEGNIVYLTNKRIISKWVNKTRFEFNIKSTDINIQLWKNVFKTNGIIITQKYETPIKIKLEKPDKWYDKIMELRNS